MDKILCQHQVPTFLSVDLTPPFFSVYLCGGTVAYLIKKSAALRFLAELETHKPYWLADDFILFGQDFNLDILVIRPLMVIENPNLVSNLEDLRGSLKNNLFKKLLKLPLKKALAIKRNL